MHLHLGSGFGFLFLFYNIYSSGFQQGEILPPRRHLAMFWRHYRLSQALLLASIE